MKKSIILALLDKEAGVSSLLLQHGLFNTSYSHIGMQLFLLFAKKSSMPGWASASFCATSSSNLASTTLWDKLPSTSLLNSLPAFLSDLFSCRALTLEFPSLHIPKLVRTKAWSHYDKPTLENLECLGPKPILADIGSSKKNGRYAHECMGMIWYSWS